MVVADWTAAAVLAPGGKITQGAVANIGQRIQRARPILCHGPATAARLKVERFAAFDVLELFAFVRPAAFCLPTVAGLAEGLNLRAPLMLEDKPLTLLQAAKALLTELMRYDDLAAKPLAEIAGAMTRGGWLWGQSVLAALGEDPNAVKGYGPAAGLRVWMRLPEWQERPPPAPPGSKPIAPEESEARLAELLGAHAETREVQRSYARSVTAAFQPRPAPDHPLLVLAEAGTGTGKTLGYVAPASLWAQRNEGAVWLSTFTRNLQRQLDQELDRLYPDPDEKKRKIVVRKGRENYLCLLNLDEAVARVQADGDDVVALGLMARWTLASRDGDMVGGDFPAWLADLLGRGATLELTDSRGECVYAACTHYKRCFVEKSIRRARRAEIVVANHALAMIQAAMGGGEEGLPTRYVFDEGHHLFHAADSAFSAHLSGLEAAELRRWILGGDGQRRSRTRGLSERLGELIEGDVAAVESLQEALNAARALPGVGWQPRLAGGAPVGPTESFLALVRQQVYARDRDADAPYSLETEPRPPVPGLLDAAAHLSVALDRLRRPLAALAAALAANLDKEAETLESSTRLRIEATMRGLERRGVLTLQAWRAMLAGLTQETPPAFVDWFGVERNDGRDIDVGFHRHWVDPMQPFAETVAEPAHGLLITSASLRDGTGDEAGDWLSARQATGANYLPGEPLQSAISSPFDYPALTRVFVVSDIRRDDADQVSAAYRELFLAAGGGALGLFTAINRLRAVHRRIAGPLEAKDIPLLAQHIGGMDTGTLIDIFREETDACLLGTDAVRDGVDVPGRSLRLIVFDRVPWPRPDILHRARRGHFGGKAYDEMLTRLKLKQAFGRLVRRADDRGVFVMLDRALPTRLLGAFPEGVAVQRIGLAEAVAETRAFLQAPRQPLGLSQVAASRQPPAPSGNSK